MNLYMHLDWSDRIKQTLVHRTWGVDRRHSHAKIIFVATLRHEPLGKSPHHTDMVIYSPQYRPQSTLALSCRNRVHTMAYGGTSFCVDNAVWRS